MTTNLKFSSSLIIISMGNVELEWSLHFCFPHVSRPQRLAPASTRTWVVRLGAQCTDHWTTGQSRGVGVPAVQLTTHVKSSTLYGRTVVHPNFFRLDGLLLFCKIMGLRKLRYYGYSRRHVIIVNVWYYAKIQPLVWLMSNITYPGKLTYKLLTHMMKICSLS